MNNISDRTSRVYIFLYSIYCILNKKKNSAIINTDNKIRKQKKKGHETRFLNIRLS